MTKLPKTKLITKKVTFYLQPELHKAIKQYAIDNDLNLSEAISKAIQSIVTQ